MIEKKGQAVTIRNLRSGKLTEVHMSHVLIVREDEVARATNGAIVPQIFPVGDYDIGEPTAASSE